MYHFRIKTDKKPDGTMVSAVKHTDYIERTGKYKNQDIKDDVLNQKFENTISGSAKDSTNNGEGILYHSPYGDIITENNSIKVSKNASIETIAIALAIAEKIYTKEKINLKGSNDFKASTLIAAQNLNLDIHFADSIIDNKYKNMQEVQKNVRRKKSGSRSGKNRNRSKIFKSDTKSIKRNELKTVTETGFSLPSLSERYMVRNMPQDADMLLYGDEAGSLDNERSNYNSTLRWDVSRSRRLAAQKTAEIILNNLQEHLDNVYAANHVEYINREAAFKKRGGCIYKNHHLPEWANDNPKTFFAAADKYEGVGNVRYKEIEFALPNELNIEQQKEIIDKFINNHLKDFYYAYAIHDKIGIMSDGEHNTHVHIMFSERKIDDAEIEKERTAEKFFAYPFRNPKTLEDKRKGGAKKDRKWEDGSRAKYLMLMRKDFAQIQNDILAKYDIPDRVDYRSIEAQKKEALARGDVLLAKLLDRMPEKHVGPKTVFSNRSEEIEKIKEYRAYKTEYRDLLYAAEIMEKAITKKTSDDTTVNNVNNVKKVTRTEEYKEQQKQKSVIVLQLKNEMLIALKDVTALNKVVVWNKDAQNLAKLKFMTSDEKERWQNLQNLQEQKNHWELFKKNLKKPADIQQEELKAYNELLPELDKKILILNQEIKDAGKATKPIFDKLSAPKIKPKIQKEAHQILVADEETKKELNKANERLAEVTTKLQHELVDLNQNKGNQIFTSQEVYDILNESYFNLNKTYKTNLSAIKKLSTRIISKERAIEMAKNVYVKGGFKKLRNSYQDLKKREEYLKKDEVKLLLEEKKLNKTIPKFWQNDEKEVYKNHKIEIENSKKLLEKRKIELSQQRIKLNKENDKLNSLCTAPEAVEKIKSIALGIIDKNQPIVLQHQNLSNTAQANLKRLNHLKEQLKGVKKQIYSDKGAKYKLASGGSGGSPSPYKSASTIADAILGDPKAVQLVARSKDKDMDKDWNMMTDFEKDEKLQEEIYKI